MAIFDAFLKLDGIKGEGTGGEITLESFSWGVSNSISSATGGAGSGKAVFQDFSFRSHAASESPDLFHACASGKHIASGELNISDKHGSLLKITFSDVLISTYKIDEMALKLDENRPSLGAPMQNVSFNFTNFTLQARGGGVTSGSTNGAPG
jgi:type VI protein secretion system component Hcp